MKGIGAFPVTCRYAGAGRCAMRLVSAYHMLDRRQDYADLGETHWQTQKATRREHRTVERLRGLGYTVVEPAA
jgi:hypothetical protein